jgi:four helix bundle protein
MKKDNLVLEKTYSFALKIIELYKEMNFELKEYQLSKQLLRSGTSIGANAEEAIGAQSKKDFISKFSIAYKESRETNYWLRLIRDSNFISREKINLLLKDSDEINRIISSIIVTSKQNS